MQTFEIADRAGTPRIVLELKSTKATLDATIVSLSYDGGPLLRPDNDLDFTWLSWATR